MTVLANALLRALLISLGTANTLAYLMIVVVAVFLVSGPIIIYIFYRKHKRETAVAPTPPSSA